jgi:molybdopterin molybdotransferase
MLGIASPAVLYGTAKLGGPLSENDERQDYLRGVLSQDTDGNAVATPFDVQDSSMLATIARADCLIVRPPHAPAAEAGAAVRFVRI